MKEIYPYVGITGFMHQAEVGAVLEVFPDSAKTGRKLMVGVLVSGKTLEGLPNRWQNRYPAIDKVRDIFLDHPDVLNLVHFNTKEKESEKILQQMLEIAHRAGENCHGFQLNLKWPNPAMIKAYKERYPDHAIVLQCGSAALEAVGEEDREERVALNLRNYREVCDYVLLDPSGGEGVQMDPQALLKYLDIFDSMPSLRGMFFGVAGGLESANLPILEPIMRKRPSTSINTERRQRDANDNLDVFKSCMFVEDIFRMYHSWGV